MISSPPAGKYYKLQQYPNKLQQAPKYRLLLPYLSNIKAHSFLGFYGPDFNRNWFIEFSFQLFFLQPSSGWVHYYHGLCEYNFNCILHIQLDFRLFYSFRFYFPLPGDIFTGEEGEFMGLIFFLSLLNFFLLFTIFPSFYDSV